MKSPNHLPFVLLVLAAAGLAGCASSPPAETVRPQQEGGDATTRLMIAEIALQRGDYPTAAREYSNAALLASDEKLAQQATQVAFEHRQDSMAAQSARRWLALNPQSEDARRHLAVVSLRLFDVEEATTQFRRLLTENYETPGAGFMDLTAILADEDNAYAMFSLMENLAADHADIPEAHYAVGVAALRSYNYERAVQAARRALELKPEFSEATQLLSRALLVNGQPEEALELSKVRAEAGDIGAQLEVGLLLSATGKDDAAREALKPLLDIPDARAEALRTLANLALEAGKLDEATEYFKDLLTTGRYVGLAFYSLGAIYERQREEVRAIRSYARITSGQYAADAQLRAARLLVNNGARDQANALLDSFLQDNPGHRVRIAIGRARMLSEEGDTAAALQVLDDTQKKYPEVQDLHYARSVVLEQGNRVNDAIAELRGEVERRPDDPVALNALGYTLAEHRRNLQEAHDLIFRALEKTPDNPAVQDSAGWVLHRLQRHEEALQYLERAYAAQREAEIAAHIGEVYWAMGEKSKAREIWQAALAVEPGHRYLLRTLRRHPE